MTRLSDLSVTELADGICLRAGRIAAAQAELFAWIAEFDRRDGWAGSGIVSCAHWLSWRIGLSPVAAREQVRVARRLEDLPEVEEAFADGRISYSKARAITRVAEPDDGVDWVGLARHSSAAQLEKIVRGMRRALANEAARLDPEQAAWSLRTRMRYDDNGNFVYTISGPAEFAPVVQAGIEAKRADVQRRRDAAAKAAADAAADADTTVADADADADETAADDAGPAPKPESRPEPPPASKSVVPPAGASAEAAQAAAEPVRESEAASASAEAPQAAAEASEEISTTSPADSSVDPDQQAPGWPAGTSWRDVRTAAVPFFAAQAHLVEEAGGWAEEPAAPTRAPEATHPAHPAAADGASAEAPTPTRVTEAEALLALAQDALAAEQAAHPDIARRRRPQLTAHVDPLSGWARQVDGELLPPSSLRQVMKTLPGRDGILRLRPITAADLHRHDLGRSQREVSLPLRELLGTLDGERCRFPGCTRHRKLHAHHVVYWSDEGATDLDNLVLVCRRHHTLIHSQGFALVLHPDRRLDVQTADGVAILHHPAPKQRASPQPRTRSTAPTC